MDGTLLALLDKAVATHGARTATRIASDDGWQTLTYAELDARARGVCFDAEHKLAARSLPVVTDGAAAETAFEIA